MSGRRRAGDGRTTRTHERVDEMSDFYLITSVCALILYWLSLFFLGMYKGVDTEIPMFFIIGIINYFLGLICCIISMCADGWGILNEPLSRIFLSFGISIPIAALSVLSSYGTGYWVGHLILSLRKSDDGK